VTVALGLVEQKAAQGLQPDRTTAGKQGFVESSGYATAT
jgi:hypothetical protein